MSYEISEEIAELKSLGIDRVRIEYSGAGDEGWINDIVGLPRDSETPRDEIPDGIQQTLQNWAYDILSENYGGWEINEGSDGVIVIDIVSSKVTITHNENIVNQTTETTTFEIEKEFPVTTVFHGAVVDDLVPAPTACFTRGDLVAIWDELGQTSSGDARAWAFVGRLIPGKEE